MVCVLTGLSWEVLTWDLSVVTIRRQLGLESGREKTQIALSSSISMWSSLMVFTWRVSGLQGVSPEKDQ